MEHYDWDKVDEVVLALLHLTLHDGSRAWKGFDWDTLDRLYAKGWITNPKNTAKSVLLTEEGVAQSVLLPNRGDNSSIPCEAIFEHFLASSPERTGP